MEDMVVVKVRGGSRRAGSTRVPPTESQLADRAAFPIVRRLSVASEANRAQLGMALYTAFGAAIERIWWTPSEGDIADGAPAKM